MVATASQTSYLDPERLYSLSGFISETGISQSRLYEARKFDIEPEKLNVGRRVFIRGRDGIAFIEKLSKHEAKLAAHEAAEDNAAAK